MVFRLISIFCSLFLCSYTAYAGNFFTTLYEFNDSDAPTIANKYDFVITVSNKASAVSTMKTVRPNLKAVYYRDALTYGDSYYLLDINTGKRIVNRDWGWYLHDISNPDYRSSLANAVASMLSGNPAFDGVMLDDVLSSLDPTAFIQEGTTSPPTFPANLSDQTSFQNSMILLIRAVRAAIGPKLIILNSGWYATNYLPEADGQVDEITGHASFQGPTEYFAGTSWLNHINAMKNAVASSKYYLGGAGVIDGATQDQINKLERYCYATFLMAVPAKNLYAKFYFNPSEYYNNYRWYADWDTQLGEPTGELYQVSGSNVYRRNFEQGIVIANPSANPGNITLEKAYCTLDGNALSNVVFADHEGVILLNCNKNAPAAPTGLRILN